MIPGPTEPPLLSGQQIDSISTYPTDRLHQENFAVYEDHVLITGAYSYATFTDTKSMEPVFGADSHTIMQTVDDYRTLEIGDIIAYEHPQMQYPVIHRIVDISFDDQGWYAITQGDNVASPDAEPVRFDQVRSVVVGILY